MKKFLLFIVLSIIPLFSIYAKEYKIDDLTIDLDESKFSVITLDDIANNPLVKEYNLDAEQLRKNYEKQYIKLEALQLNEEKNGYYYDIFVAEKYVKNAKNLHSYSEKQINDVKKEILKKVDAIESNIYKTNEYTYVSYLYKDSLDAKTIYIYDYYTVINENGYTIKFQKQSEFTDEDIKVVKGIVDKIRFSVDTKYNKKSSYSSTIISAITAGIIGALYSLFKPKKKIEKKEEGNKAF